MDEFTFDPEPIRELLITQHRAALETQVERGMLTSNEAALLAAHYSVGSDLQRATDATLAMMRAQVESRVH